MKSQALFSSKDKSEKLKCRLLQFLFGTFRVKQENLKIKVYVPNTENDAITRKVKVRYESLLQVTDRQKLIRLHHYKVIQGYKFGRVFLYQELLPVLSFHSNRICSTSTIFFEYICSDS